MPFHKDYIGEIVLRLADCVNDPQVGANLLNYELHDRDGKIRVAWPTVMAYSYNEETHLFPPLYTGIKAKSPSFKILIYDIVAYDILYKTGLTRTPIHMDGPDVFVDIDNRAAPGLNRGV